MAYSDEQWQQHAENKLWEMIDGVEVVTEKLDKDGVPHELRSKLPPNVDAIKFALKNRSKGKWADKTEVTHTQINVNLTASYDEVKRLMEQQKGLSDHSLPSSNGAIPTGLFDDDEDDGDIIDGSISTNE